MWLLTSDSGIDATAPPNYSIAKLPVKIPQLRGVAIKRDIIKNQPELDRAV